MDNPLLAITRNTRLPLRLRKKIGKLLRPPKNQDFTAPVFESSYQGRTGIHMNDKVYLYGMHESATIRLLRGIAKHQSSQGLACIYLDIGTNTGLHILAIAPLAEKAFGFEPYEPVRAIAKGNIENNTLNHVTVFDFGLSDEDAINTFYCPTNNNLGTGSFLAENDDDGASANILKLQVRRGDAVMEEHGIIPTLIKIDIEGYEEKAFKGLRETIKTHRPVIIFEYSDQSRSSLGSLKTLETLFGPDYSFYGILRSRETPKLSPFNPDRKYENVLAWPYESNPSQVLI